MSKPKVVAEHSDLDLTQLSVGLIDDPSIFEVGIAQQLDGAPMLVFLADGKPVHALAFRGAAADKLLQSFYAMIDLFFGTTGEEESPRVVVPEETKKKQTLH